MKIRDVMTDHVECVLGAASLTQAAGKMKEHDVGALAVVNDGKPHGIVTDRDIVLRSVAMGRHPSETKLTDIMSAEPEFCSSEDDVVEAAEQMARRSVRRLLVQDPEGKLCGIVSLGDLARESSAEGVAGRVLGSISREDGSANRAR